MADVKVPVLGGHCTVCERKRPVTGICGYCKMEVLFLNQIQEMIAVEELMRQDPREPFLSEVRDDG